MSKLCAVMTPTWIDMGGFQRSITSPLRREYMCPTGKLGAPSLDPLERLAWECKTRSSLPFLPIGIQS